MDRQSTLPILFLFTCLCIACALFFSSATQANTESSPTLEQLKVKLQDATFSELYYEARMNYSSRPDVFLKIISIIDARKGTFTSLEIQKFKYIKAFSHFINGDANNVIKEMEALYPTLLTDKMKYKVALLIVNAAAYSKTYSTALYYLQEAEQVLPKVKEQVKIGTYYTLAMTIYKDLKQYDIALKHVKDYLALPNLNVKELCEAHYNQVEALYDQGVLNSNSPEIAKTIPYCEPKDGLKLMLTYSMKISLLLSEKKPNEALQLIKETDISHTQSSFKMIQAAYLLHYAQVYLQLNDLDKAIDYAQRSLEFFQNESRPKTLIEVYNTLHFAYKQKGDLTKALDYYVRYMEEKQYNLNEGAEKLLAFQLAKFKITEKLNEIEVLNNQNKLLLLEQKLIRENEQNNQLIIILLMVIVLFLMLWMYRSNQVQKQLKEIAQVDALTRIANRRYFTEVANKHLRQSIQNNTPLSVLLFDLDKFKSINDTYGHGIGDWVLIETAKACKSSIRESDMVGRLGGEEFGVLLPNCDREQAVHIAEKCRKALLAIDTTETEFQFTVSGSFGVSDVAESGYTLKDILHNCDEALYEAKHRGRNQVVEYPFKAQEVAV